MPALSFIRPSGEDWSGLIGSVGRVNKDKSGHIGTFVWEFSIIPEAAEPKEQADDVQC